MKSINIAPTWRWIASFTLRLIDDNNLRSKKAEKAFVAELSRLGSHMKILIKEYKKTRSPLTARFILEYAERCDAKLEAKK